MAGLGTVTTAFQRTSIDSPTSNTSSATMSTSMSHSTHSRTNSASSHSHYGNGTLDWDGSKHGSVDTLNISIPDEFDVAERYSRLVELQKVPWNEQLIGRVLRNSEKVCQLVDRIPQSVVQRLSFLMQRPFVRVVREVKRLSIVYAKCTKHEIQTAVKLVMSPSLADACMNAAVKALSLYQMSSEQMRRGKTARAGLTFRIGRFFRWLVEARISSRVDDHAALYLAASMEALTSELFFRACAPYFEKTDGELTQAVLDYGIANEAELWGMLQPYEHLICGRNSSDMKNRQHNPSPAKKFQAAVGELAGE
ncbi:ankyrin repeat and BTB/POZ domain-containing protein BTBD11-like [Strongylocentrotus purpuratus]|uniref:ABTB2/3 histone-like domain-containing protein n=1 Tax=Strongylocentrotus purpuratus TaxID=7668 RepID=A0A7M7T0P1_STRPU|nr:ankyrin repeat and BTB/POZ domain-containing protein BTBD11-like [Strongylocentrotus purpuratus]